MDTLVDHSHGGPTGDVRLIKLAFSIWIGRVRAIRLPWSDVRVIHDLHGHGIVLICQLSHRGSLAAIECIQVIVFA